MIVSGGIIERMRIAVNGAAARPLRLKAVEDGVRGKELLTDLFLVDELLKTQRQAADLVAIPYGC